MESRDEGENSMELSPVSLVTVQSWWAFFGLIMCMRSQHTDGIKRRRMHSLLKLQMCMRMFTRRDQSLMEWSVVLMRIKQCLTFCQTMKKQIFQLPVHRQLRCGSCRGHALLL